MKKSVNDYGSKKLMILSLFTIIFVTVFSTSFALYSYNKIGNENTIKSGTVEILLTEPNANTTLVTPFASEKDILASDEYMEFKVGATATGTINTNYYIYFTENSGNTIDRSKIKMNLTLYENNTEKEVVSSKFSSDFMPINLSTLAKDTTSDKYLLYQNSFNFADSGTLTDTYRLRIWTTEGNINYTENGKTHTATLEGEYSIKINVYAVQDTSVPDTLADSCFTATVNDTNKTATLTGYLCNDKEISIPSTINSYVSNTYSVKENPTDEEIAACKQVFTDFGLTPNTVCSGGTSSGGTTLESYVTDASTKDAYGAALKDTGIINVSSETITLNTAYAVNTLGGNLFRGRGLTKVIIPKTITTINDSALSDNNLVSIVIPDSVTTLGTYVFYDNDLKSVYLSKNITSIREAAFGSNKLASVAIPNSVTTIGDFAFYENNLQSITIPNNVTTIEYAAFWNNDIKSLDLGSGVTTIGNYAFGQNELTTLVIPNNVTSIGGHAFKVNRLTSVTLSENITTLPGAVFAYNYLSTLNIPDQVTSIGEGAFAGNNLNYVYIGANSQLTANTGIGKSPWQTSDYTASFEGKNYTNNPNLTTIYNNSGKAFDFQYSVNGTTGTVFVTGAVPSYTSSSGTVYNAVTVTTGEPQ